MTLKRTGPYVFFLISTFVRQPTWFLRIGRAVQYRGISGIHREAHRLNHLFGVGPWQYRKWIRRFDTLTDVDRDAIQRRIEAMPVRPRFSIVMPVYNTAEDVLKKAIESVVRQLYPNWELCIADDASPEPHVRRILDEFQASDTRIRCRFCVQRGNISVASNEAMQLASGEFVVCLDHDDVLAEHALYMVAEEVNREPEVQIIYSDEDRLDENGRRVDPYFKTDWNPDLMLSQNMICHLAAYRRELVCDVGGFRIGSEGAQDHDLALRCTEQTSMDKIRHIPTVLYHWRSVPGSVSKGTATAVKAHEAGARAIREHLVRKGVQAGVSIETERGSPHYRVRYSLPEPPRVTVIIPTRDRLDLLRRCVDGLLNDTDYPNLEITIVDNGSSEPATHQYFASLKQYHGVRILEYTGAFNYSSINNYAVQHSSGEVLCLLNNDTEITHGDWLHEMVSHAVRDEIGAVGAKLIYPDDTIQHAGILVGAGGLARHTFAGLPNDAPVVCGRLDVVQNVSGVTAACMVLRRSVYNEVGGFEEDVFPVGYNDVDLCLRIVSANYRIVWTPYAQLYHHESASRGQASTAEEKELDLRQANALRRRWSTRITADPNLNPNISIDNVDYRPAFPPRTRRPWC
jgi:glycosyltransferase involved in cell wall biosynthesis